MFTSCGPCVYGFTHLYEPLRPYPASCVVSFLGVEDYACESFLAANAIRTNRIARMGESIAMNRVLFVERSGELRLLARLSTKGAEPKGNQV